MRRLLIVFGVIVFLIVAPFVPQVPGWFVVNMPKTGRVVDRETGKGLPNVFVLASAKFYQGPTGFLAGQGTFGPLYRVVTRTDAQGYFRIPNTWSHRFVAVPWASWGVSWVVTAFEPGYVVAGDEASFETRSDERRAYSSLSTSASPDIVGISGFSLRIGDIQVYRREMTLSDAAWYYENIVSVSNPRPLSLDGDDFAIKAKAFEFFAPWVCGMQPEQEMRGSTAAQILNMVGQPLNVIKILQEINPDYVPRDGYGKLKFAAGDICKAVVDRVAKP